MAERASSRRASASVDRSDPQLDENGGAASGVCARKACGLRDVREMMAMEVAKRAEPLLDRKRVQSRVDGFPSRFP